MPSLSSIVFIDFIVPKISGSFVISGGIYAGVQVYESGVFYIGKGYNQGYGSLIEFIFAPYIKFNKVYDESIFFIFY